MMKILAKPWELLKGLFGLAFPMFRGGGTATADVPGAWVARGALLAVILAGLYMLNRSETLALKNVIPHRIGAYWLPLFAFCVYAMIWMGWWLYRLLNLEVASVISEYQDIDRAWGQAIEAMRRADIHFDPKTHLDATPLFLVLGGSSRGEEVLFHAAGIKALVKQVPRDPAEPLHVTANHEGIWVTCPGASILGQQLLALEDGGDGRGEVTLDTLSEGSSDPFKTMGGLAGGGATLRIEDFVASERQNLSRLFQHGSRKPKRSVDFDKYAARLRYLCHLIARDRQGFCPVNGVLLVLPVTLTDPGIPVSEITSACRTDLAEAFDVFRMRCPVLALVSDLEKLPGFPDLVERLPSGQIRNRMGQRFPLVPEIDADETPLRIRDSVSWIGTTLFPSMVHSLFQVEVSGGQDVTEVVRVNSQLYRFLATMRDRHERLAQVVKDCLPTLSGEPILYRGCYLAGTGTDSVTEQAFASSVLRRLIDDQDNVTWTSAALLQDAGFTRVARGLRIFLLCLIVLGIGGILLVIGRHWMSRSKEEIPD
jgi:hypothetical protein